VSVVRGLLAVGLALAGGFALAAEPQAAPPGADPVEWSRHLNSPSEPIGSAGWYQPTEPIGSGPGAPLKVAAPEKRTLPADALDAALAYAKSTNSYGVLVAHRGVVQLEYYKDGFGPERLLDSQSMHKPLAAIVTMAAVADGKLSLADPLSRWLPQWRDDPRGRITVEQVLRMQTGLEEPPFEQKFGNRAYELFITTHLEQKVFGLAAEDPPGSRFKVHYAATQLLQWVIEAATGKRYSAYLAERIWAPLGGGEARVRVDRPGGNALVFCCIESRPRDWLRVGLMLAGHGTYENRTVLPLQQFLQLTTPSPLSPNFGMQQVWRGSPYSPIRLMDSRNPARGLKNSAPFAAEDVFYLEGRGGQRVYVVPSRELVVVRQGEIRMDWDDVAFLNPLILGVPAREGSKPSPAAAPGALPSPATGFSALLAPPAPDYTKADAWSRRPADSFDGAKRATSKKGAAAFYVHHTTYGGNERWNAAYDDPAVAPGVDAVVLGQGSTLEACCDLWAPRYRQASIVALGIGMLPYDLAYLDVLAAFREFLARNPGRPIVLMGHSQGALHVQRLVTEVVDRDPALAKRLVVAYVVGIPVPTALYAKTLTRVKACASAKQTGCIAVWATYSPTNANIAAWRERARLRFAAMMTEAGDRGLQCTNPLNWRADETAAPATANLGAKIIDKASGTMIAPVKGGWGARCSDGALLLDGEPSEPFRPYQYDAGNWHLADVALFHANVSANAAERVTAWRRARH
jgi:CubicO group peptidase (beta-lactamase class C family)/alpha-beta hydrolase superfamily lysophospholipase